MVWATSNHWDDKDFSYYDFLVISVYPSSLTSYYMNTTLSENHDTIMLISPRTRQVKLYYKVSHLLLNLSQLYFISHFDSITRMHSSRMRTARSSSRPGGCPPGPSGTRHPPDQAPPSGTRHSPSPRTDTDTSFAGDKNRYIICWLFQKSFVLGFKLFLFGIDLTSQWTLCHSSILTYGNKIGQ